MPVNYDSYLSKIADEYDGDRDMIPGGPDVNWVDENLRVCVKSLVAEVSALKKALTNVQQGMTFMIVVTKQFSGHASTIIVNPAQVTTARFESYGDETVAREGIFCRLYLHSSDGQAIYENDLALAIFNELTGGKVSRP